MRFLRVTIGLLGFLVTAEGSAAESQPASGNYYARVRANDAPLAGRFTVFGYMLDTLDAVVELPGPGRILALNFRESTGKKSFLIPSDLGVEDYRHQVWSGGFLPLDDTERLSGLLDKDESPWALWWIPLGTDSLLWESPTDIKLKYGLTYSRFYPLPDKEAEKFDTFFPWSELDTLSIDPGRTTRDLVISPDPAAFDVQPQIQFRKSPAYPKTSRMFNFSGTVYVVALVNEEGRVEDAFVLASDASHDLNVSALSSVVDWEFEPGRKSGERVAGEVIIPVTFSLGSSR